MATRRYIRTKNKASIRGIGQVEAQRVRNELELAPAAEKTDEAIVANSATIIDHEARLAALEAGTYGLTLVATTTPDDPDEGQAIIWLDEFGDIWAKSTYGGATQTGQVFDFVLDSSIVPGTAEIFITGQTLTVVAGTQVIPLTASIEVTGQTPTLFLDHLLAPGTATITIIGRQPTVLSEVREGKPMGLLLTLTYSSADLSIAPSTASITITGQPVLLSTDIGKPIGMLLGLTYGSGAVGAPAVNVPVYPITQTINVTGQQVLLNTDVGQPRGLLLSLTYA